MTTEVKGQYNGSHDGLISYHPVAAKICSLIASQSVKDSPLQENAAMISGCIGSVPTSLFEQDWKNLVATLPMPGTQAGIGACIG